MTFVRVKHIAGQDYAYLVENYWTDKGSRQRAKKYLGRVHTFPRTQTHFFDNNPKQFSDLITQLCRIELLNHGFAITDDPHKFGRDEIIIDLTSGKMTKNNKNITLQCNEGFLCQDTYLALRDFSPTTASEFKLELVNALLGAGVQIQPDQFITIYEACKEKINKPTAAREET